MTTDAITIAGLDVSYRQRPVLSGLTAHIPAGTLSALVGPNGAGKSTLLKACLGLVPARAGEVRLLGRPVVVGRTDVAYVPQCGTVDWDFPITVGEVVSMGCSARRGWFRRLGTEGRARVARCLARVGMSDLAGRPVGELSGGQRQRVFLARALAQDAELLLLDEPFAGIDAPTEVLLLDLLEDLCAQGQSVVVVHHDLTTVRERFGWALLLGSGNVTAAGPPEEVLAPEAVMAAYGGGRTRPAAPAKAAASGPGSEGLAWAS